MLIITMFSLSIVGCGYKASPFYPKRVVTEDKNVIFIQNSKNENVSNLK